VVSEAALKNGVNDLIDQITRYNEFRYTTWVYGTRGNVESILLASPILDKSPVYSQLRDPNDVYRQSLFVRPLRLHELILSMNDPGRTPRLPMFALSLGDWQDITQLLKLKASVF
jgi:hypothetical protein